MIRYYKVTTFSLIAKLSDDYNSSNSRYLYILFGRYEKYGMEGLSKFKERRITTALKQSIIEEHEKDILPLWWICVEYDISFSSVCRWVRQYKQGGYEELFRHGPRGRPKKLPLACAGFFNGEVLCYDISDRTSSGIR